ncbi:hypothetical protein SAMN05421578_12917 [Paenibacillus macquariensis]|uniref:Uncharacterized protein n=2 Tax=Paenibacillus macquariensis TaxID=948756 RepID=A0ABY1KDK7_9BACL|nr:hypothetical protein SAMN05421578_12917 [Paenibacillus macquariensis]
MVKTTLHKGAVQKWVDGGYGQEESSAFGYFQAPDLDVHKAFTQIPVLGITKLQRI